MIPRTWKHLLYTISFWVDLHKQFLFPKAEHYADMRKIFKASQVDAEMIWSRWCREYVPQWNSGPKWNQTEAQQPEIGELMLLVDDSTKRGKQYRAGDVGTIQIFMLLLRKQKNKSRGHRWVLSTTVKGLFGTSLSWAKSELLNQGRYLAKLFL